jgi:hypothetical protein
MDNLIVKRVPMKPIAAFIAGFLFLVFANAFADVQLRKTGDAWQLFVGGTPFTPPAISIRWPRQAMTMSPAAPR